jgi:hypothetical protein
VQAQLDQSGRRLDRCRRLVAGAQGAQSGRYAGIARTRISRTVATGSLIMRRSMLELRGHVDCFPFVGRSGRTRNVCMSLHFLRITFGS